MRIGYIYDGNGTFERKWIQPGDEGKDPKVLYKTTSVFGDYIWSDEEHINDAKNVLLEQLLDTIRSLAKLDEFWIVKREDDYRLDAKDNPLREVQGLSVEEFIPQEAKERKCTIGWKIDIPQLECLYPWDESQEIEKKMQECIKPLNK